MAQDVELSCRCGAIRGWARDIAPSGVSRGICYCDDCQAFLQYLGRGDLLDDHAGTDLVQLPPAAVSFERGADRIAGVRLTAKGMDRWYASCCKTPLGNTRTPALPFIGMALEVFRGAPDARRRDEVFGAPRARMLGQYAIGGVPEGSTKFPVMLMLRAVWLVLGWKLRGKTWPHPFFDRATKAPVHPLTTLSPAEREALRAKCGPHPIATAQA